MLKSGPRMVMIATFALGAATAISSPAQTFTTLATFNETNGAQPLYAPLVQGLDGNFYGTTTFGGANSNSVCTGFDLSGCGTVFKVTGGTLTTIYSFCAKSGCTDGAGPVAGLVLGNNGNFYGTTSVGGANGDGTVFEITPGGVLTTLYSFCAVSGCADGAKPDGGLVFATNGNLYGTTAYDGANHAGTVFEITPTGTLTTLYSFCSQSACSDGENPQAGLLQASNGNLYGTTFNGGASLHGTVFEITPGGKLTTLHSFNGTDGQFPGAVLIQATDANIFGTTPGGGVSNWGTVFKMTPAGVLTTLYSFCALAGCADGSFPEDRLVQATDGNLYGTTQEGGANSNCTGGCGTAFKMTLGGVLTTLHSFAGADGQYPTAGLAQGTNGTFYGTSSQGGGSGACGTLGCGTVFSLAVGLHPFVALSPTSGKVGANVKVLGNNLTGTTSVTFNGMSAVFNVKSATEIIATVPSGATSGPVKVTTSHGTLTSNTSFRVLP